MKELLKWANIWQSYSKNKSGPVFLTHSVHVSPAAACIPALLVFCTSCNGGVLLVIFANTFRQNLPWVPTMSDEWRNSPFNVRWTALTAKKENTATALTAIFQQKYSNGYNGLNIDNEICRSSRSGIFPISLIAVRAVTVFSFIAIRAVCTTLISVGDFRHTGFSVMAKLMAETTAFNGAIHRFLWRTSTTAESKCRRWW